MDLTGQVQIKKSGKQ